MAYLDSVTNVLNTYLKETTGYDVKQFTDFVSKSLGRGSLSQANAMMLRGINHRGLGNPVKMNRDNSGIILFTRPDLNLSHHNISVVRELTAAITDQPYSIARYIRAVLDPQGNRSLDEGKCPLVDPLNPFIPVLTNSLINLDGWPDPMVQYRTSKEGVFNEALSAIDGFYKITGEYSVTANFKNYEGNVILGLLHIWLTYAANVYAGEIHPYPHNLINRRMDYNTRIYHFALDPSRQFITGSVNCGASFPNTNPLGSMFRYVGDQAYVQSSEQLSVQFVCNVAEYNDPILPYEFNKRVGMFNPALVLTAVGDNGTFQLQGGDKYIKLDSETIQAGNYYGTPLIHPITYELMWFVERGEYDRIVREGFGTPYNNPSSVTR